MKGLFAILIIALIILVLAAVIPTLSEMLPLWLEFKENND